MDKEFFAHIYYSGYHIQKINSYFAHFRWHGSNKSIDTKEVKLIRFKEGLETFNRYSGLKLPYNSIGIFVHKSLNTICGFYRTCSRKLKISIYA